MTVGIGWFDGDILRHNGFTVHENPSYDGLFKTTAINRIDLFCRSATEIKGEYEKHLHINQLTYDRTKAFYYPFPNVFYLNKNNSLAIDRLTVGLQRALEDGSFEELWKKSAALSTDFIRINSRQVFYLENPLLGGEEKALEKYYYPPFLKVKGELR